MAGVGVLALLVVLRAARVTGLTSAGLPLAATKGLGLAAVAALWPVMAARARSVWLLWVSGGALNLLAIALGGGRMPVSAGAVEAVGLPPSHPNYVHADSWPTLLVGDSIPLTFPVATVVSGGDLLIATGLGWLAWLLFGPARSRSAVPSRGRTPTHATEPDR